MSSFLNVLLSYVNFISQSISEFMKLLYRRGRLLCH